MTPPRVILYVTYDNENIIVKGNKIKVSAERTRKHSGQSDVVVESTVFSQQRKVPREATAYHLKNGAKKVI